MQARREFPIGMIAEDALLMLMRQVSQGSKMPSDMALAYVEMENLELRGCNMPMRVAHGHGEIWEMLHELVEVTGHVAKGGTNEYTLRETFREGGRTDGRVAVVVRVKELASNGLNYEVLGTSKLDNRLVTLKPTRESVAPGATRVTITSYQRLMQSGMGIEHFPLVLTQSNVPGSPACKIMAEQMDQGITCVVCQEQKKQMVLSACGHHVCCTCGMKWRKAKGAYTCPICRLDLPQFDSIYSSDLAVALAPQFHRTHCCWCGKMARFRCRCHLFEYCSTKCKATHSAAGHGEDCTAPWFLPVEQQLPPGGFWEWTGKQFEERS